MTKIFTRYIVNTFMLVTFSLSQITNVNASHYAQKEEITDCIMAQVKNVTSTATRIITLYAPDVNYRIKNKATVEGKIEKVLEPIKIGNFGFGILTGYAATAGGLLLGWVLSAIISMIKFPIGTKSSQK